MIQTRLRGCDAHSTVVWTRQLKETLRLRLPPQIPSGNVSQSGTQYRDPLVTTLILLVEIHRSHPCSTLGHVNADDCLGLKQQREETGGDEDYPDVVLCSH